MRLLNLPKEFMAAKPVLAAIEQAGFEAYFVGGCVRDTLLGIPLHDIDIASSAYPAEIKTIFKKTVDTGIEHGTVMVLDHGTGYEITTFRTESTYQDFRRPDHVEFVRSLSEDLKRRDLTINALALKADGEVIDHFGGIDDLHNKVIKAVGDANERFHEDALRMMRAVRFASQLDFTLADKTKAAITKNAPLLQKIAVERIYVEFVKLMQGQAKAKGIAAMQATNLTAYCPTPQVLQTSLTKTLNLPQLDNIKLTNEVSVWALLAYLADFSGNQISQFLKKWKAANHVIDAVKKVVAALPKIIAQAYTNDTLFYLGYDLLAVSCQVANLLGSDVSLEQLQADYAKLPIKDKHELAINGKILMTELNFTPGRQMGSLLNQALKLVIANKLPNQTASLLSWANQQKN